MLTEGIAVQWLTVEALQADGQKPPFATGRASLQQHRERTWRRLTVLSGLALVGALACGGKTRHSHSEPAAGGSGSQVAGSTGVGGSSTGGVSTTGGQSTTGGVATTGGAAPDGGVATGGTGGRVAPTGGAGEAGGGAGSGGSEAGNAGTGGTIPPCGPGEGWCGTGADAGCVDVTSDVVNCGRCGNVCPNGATCSEGSCQLVACATPAVFRGPLPNQVGEGPIGVVVEDFNGDGLLDVATANTEAGTVSVLLGNGDGTLTPHLDYATDPGLTDLVAVDLNDDGVLDLVTANSETDTVVVRLGSIEGTFADGVSYPTGTGPRQILFGDWNGDGTWDLATRNETASSVTLLFGAGDGTFGGSPELPTVGAPTSMAVADLNGDGNWDLVLADIATQPMVHVLYDLMDGVFDTQAAILPRAAASMVLADVDADGDLDLVMGSECDDEVDPVVTVMHNTGDGYLAQPIDYALAHCGAPLAVGDIDDDDDLDVVSSTLSTVLGRENRGVFDPGPEVPAGRGGDAVALGDLNGDGLLDAVTVSSSANTVDVHLGDGNATFGTTQVQVGGSLDAIALGNMDGNGTLDLATATRADAGTPDSAGAVATLLNAGTGVFSLLASQDLEQSVREIELAPLDDDDYPELVAIDASGVVVFKGATDGSLGSPRHYETGSDPRALEVGSMNGDALPDIVVANAEGTLSLLLGKADGTFEPGPDQDVGHEPSVLQLHDLDRDGAVDAAVGFRDTNEIAVLRGQGDGTFRDAQRFELSTPSVALVVGDLNDDGNGDLVSGNGTASVSVLLGRGDGTFRPPVDYGLTAAPTALALGDLNDDGNWDLAVANGTAEVLFGLGDGTFDCAETSPDISAHLLAVGDVNSDDRLDLALGASDAVILLLNQQP